jgi:hypothetical protein
MNTLLFLLSASEGFSGVSVKSKDQTGLIDATASLVLHQRKRL